MPTISLSASIRSHLRSSGASEAYVDSYIVNSLSPDFVLDFKGSAYRTGGTSTSLSSAVTHARGSSATMVDSSGNLVTVGSNVPRAGHHIHNGSTWVNEGILHESETRTNLLLNSGTLATQNVTLTAVPTTLSFTGTGSVTISGVTTNGTGTGEENRVSFTFTPAAGSISIIASGTVTNAQLEVGRTVSSYIPTSGSTVTRAADTLTIPAANMPYNSTNMSIQMDGKMTYADTGVSTEVRPYRWRLNSNNYILVDISTVGGRTGQPLFKQRHVTSGLDQIVGAFPGVAAGTNIVFNIASRHGSSFLNGAKEGGLLTANNTPTDLPNLSSTNLELGQKFMGTIAQFVMWDEDLTDSGIIEASTV